MPSRTDLEKQLDETSKTIRSLEAWIKRAPTGATLEYASSAFNGQHRLEELRILFGKQSDMREVLKQIRIKRSELRQAHKYQRAVRTEN